MYNRPSSVQELLSELTKAIVVKDDNDGNYGNWGVHCAKIQIKWQQFL